MRSRNRVVVTGMGVVAPNGIGLDPFWDSLLGGRSAIGPITAFDASSFPCRIAGEVRNFRPGLYLDPRVKTRRMNRFTQFTLVAAEMALRHAGLKPEALDRLGPVPLCIGVSMGGFERLESNVLHVARKGPKGVFPSEADACLHMSAVSALSAMWGVSSRLLTVSNTCVGGLDAIASAAGEIQEGKADIAVAGGSDAAIVPTVLAGLCAAGMVSNRNDVPLEASRPFDRDRDGGVLAEGAGIVILENLKGARARGARIFLEILGYGSSADRIDGESGNGLETSVREALDNSAMYPFQADAILAHGPSDAVLDRMEAVALNRVFGPHARRAPVYSIKGVTGNPLAAGGAHQVIAAGLSFASGRLPPTANCRNPDPDCDLDLVRDEPRRFRARTLLINAHGSGRVNSSLMLKAGSTP